MGIPIVISFIKTSAAYAQSQGSRKSLPWQRRWPGAFASACLDLPHIACLPELCNNLPKIPLREIPVPAIFNRR